MTFFYILFFSFLARFVIIFAYVKCFPTFANLIGLNCVFWIHSGVAMFAGILAIFIMPETHGKTLTELSKMFSKNDNLPT